MHSTSDIYNPWSIASFIDNDGEYDTYWADTSGNGLVISLIRQGNTTVKSAMEDLLAGRTLTTELNEQIVFRYCRKISDADCAEYFFEVKLLKQLSKNVGVAGYGEAFWHA